MFCDLKACVQGLGLQLTPSPAKPLLTKINKYVKFLINFTVSLKYGTTKITLVYCLSQSGK